MSVTLAQVTGPAYTRIYSYGAARGENAVPNEDLIGPIDSSDEWIRQRTGIITRARADKGTDAIDLATTAAAEAIEKSGVPADQVDLVIVGDHQQPEADPPRSRPSSPTASVRIRPPPTTSTRPAPDTPTRSPRPTR